MLMSGSRDFACIDPSTARLFVYPTTRSMSPFGPTRTEESAQAIGGPSGISGPAGGTRHRRCQRTDETHSYTLHGATAPGRRGRRGSSHIHSEADERFRLT